MRDAREIWDISPEISSETAVFPGDLPFRRRVMQDFPSGDNLTLSNIETTLHIGAHVDAPSHYHAQGQAITGRDLNFYLGECQVISVVLPRGERILPVHLKGLEITASRVLFRTLSFPDPNLWNDDFNSLSAELISYLAERGVILVGIDTPSVDPARDKTLEAHQAIFRHQLANLEGVVLKDVQDGLYELTALPLKLKDADASPVRAILSRRRS